MDVDCRLQIEIPNFGVKIQMGWGKKRKKEVGTPALEHNMVSEACAFRGFLNI